LRGAAVQIPSFFQGFFEKSERQRWFFGGSGVVNCLVNVDRKTHVFEL
jgi:hypothetical protein